MTQTDYKRHTPQNILLFFDDHSVCVSFSHKTFGKVVYFVKTVSFRHYAALKILEFTLNRLQTKQYIKQREKDLNKLLTIAIVTCSSY